MHLQTLAIATSFACLGDAAASSPAAWDAHYRTVVDRCLERSRLRDARPASDLMLFPDAIGTALLVRGARKAGGKPHTLLCIVRRGSGDVELRDPDEGIDVPPPRR